MKVQGTKVIFDSEDWLAGLYQQYTSDLAPTPTAHLGKKLQSATGFDPYRWLGYASPSQQFEDATNVSVVTDYLRDIAYGRESSTDYGYLIGANNRLHRLDLSTKTLSNGGSWPRTITTGVTGNAEGWDVVSYPVNVASVRTRGILYSWNDTGGAWNIGLFNQSSGAFTDNYFTATAASPITPSGNNKPHPMIVGVDDVVYVGDGNKLHGIDGAEGANGTVLEDLLVLADGYIITSFGLLDNYLVIFAYYSSRGNTASFDTTGQGPAKAFFWDYQSRDATFIVDLYDAIVTSAFTFKNTVGCFTQGNNLAPDGSNRFGRLKMWDGSKFETVEQFIGNAPIDGGVDIVGDSIQWNSQGIIHTYGSPFEGQETVLNRFHDDASGTTSGMLRTVAGASGYQLISCGTTTSGGLKYSTNNYTSNASVSTNRGIFNFPSGMVGRIKEVTIRFAKSATGGRSLNAYLVTDNATTTQFMSSVSTVTAGNLAQRFQYDINGGVLPRFQEVGVILQWQAGLAATDAPIVRSVEVEIETTNIVPTT